MTVHLFHRRSPAVAFVPDQTQPRALIAPVDTRIAQLMSTFSYVHVSIDPHFEPEDCKCGDGTTSVRVYGDDTAVPAVADALVEVETCLRCALAADGPVPLAWSESRSDRDIRVEVCA
jgi:hypothetical protein